MIETLPLYSLGTRDEKWNEIAHDQKRRDESSGAQLSRGIYFWHTARWRIAADQGAERLHVRFPTGGLGEPVEWLGSAAQSLLEFISVCGARAGIGLIEVKLVFPRRPNTPQENTLELRSFLQLRGSTFTVVAEFG
jgi:hypothetical protein